MLSFFNDGDKSTKERIDNFIQLLENTWGRITFKEERNIYRLPKLTVLIKYFCRRENRLHTI